MVDEILPCSRPKTVHAAVLAAAFCLVSATTSLFCVQGLFGQKPRTVWSPEETRIIMKLQGLRRLSDKARGRATKHLALESRQLPPSDNKLRLAAGLASLSTEGDPGGRETLQEVTTTLADALREHPLPASGGQPAAPYAELAALVRYENMQAHLSSAEFTAALTQLEKQDERRQRADFTLIDLQGRKWTLKSLRGKVVLVNFWATWCPPCRKEIPDLKALYERFKGQGLVVLGIADDAENRVRAFAQKQKIPYPILLDPGRKVEKLFSVEGIPMSFLYDRNGKLVVEAIDMRTRTEFLAMLAKAGLR